MSGSLCLGCIDVSYIGRNKRILYFSDYLDYIDFLPLILKCLMQHFNLRMGGIVTKLYLEFSNSI